MAAEEKLAIISRNMEKPHHVVKVKGEVFEGCNFRTRQQRIKLAPVSRDMKEPHHALLRF